VQASDFERLTMNAGVVSVDPYQAAAKSLHSCKSLPKKAGVSRYLFCVSPDNRTESATVLNAREESLGGEDTVARTHGKAAVPECRSHDTACGYSGLRVSMQLRDLMGALTVGPNSNIKPVICAYSNPASIAAATSGKKSISSRVPRRWPVNALNWFLPRRERCGLGFSNEYRAKINQSLDTRSSLLFGRIYFVKRSAGKRRFDTLQIEVIFDCDP
jgi:hypothetical protein